MSVAAARGCLDDLEAFALIGGTAAPDRLAELVAHADACALCHELIAGLCLAEASPARDAARPPDDGGPRDPLVGDEVAGGAYALGPLLAAGGMGRIYRATDRALGREVALKVPRSASRWLVRRFEREVAITARLAHPGIVPVYAAGRLLDGRPFYVMPILDGVPLDLALQRAADRAQRLALVDHLVDVASTMAFVHAQGIAHRDLKPQNIVIGRTGETSIIDWGLAKELAPRGGGAPTSRVPAPATASGRRDRDARLDADDRPAGVARAEPEAGVDRLDHLDAAPAAGSDSIAHVLAGRTTRPGDVLGTPAFMSPEQARGEPIDQRADVYALGAMLEQLLTGRLPRKAADAALALAPPALVAICRRAMADDREARHADCGELAAELRAATRAPATSAAPATTTRSAPPWRLVMIIVALAALALGAVLARVVGS